MSCDHVKKTGPCYKTGKKLAGNRVKPQATKPMNNTPPKLSTQTTGGTTVIRNGKVVRR